MLEVAIEKRLDGFRLAAEFEAPADGIIVLFGRSGAGKTSIINALAGLLRPDRGRVSLADTPLFDSDRGIDLPPERRRLGYVFQDGRLFPHLSVKANLLYGFKRVPRAERVIELDQVVPLLGLEGLLGRAPARLSGGEKQRVALGRALLANPRLLLMDEPLAALDQARKEEVLPFIERLRDELSLPIVYVSHNMDEVVRLADTLVLISEGGVAAVGPVEALMSRLDLRPLTGRYEAGAVIEAEVVGHDQVFQLSELKSPAGRLRVARLDLPLGTRLRLRVRARDVALSLSQPEGISISNVLPATVQELSQDEAPFVDVLLSAGAATLWSRITRRSAAVLRLAPGRPVYALIKTVAIDRPSLGRRGGRERFLKEE